MSVSNELTHKENELKELETEISKLKNQIKVRDGKLDEYRKDGISITDLVNIQEQSEIETLDKQDEQ